MTTPGEGGQAEPADLRLLVVDDQASIHEAGDRIGARDRA